MEDSSNNSLSGRCRECGKRLFGRSDKKYCSDTCRVAFNNRKYRNNSSAILLVNRILKKNHSILEDIITHYGESCPFDLLLKKGYNFDYLTSIEENPNIDESLKMYCYDLSFSINSAGTVSIFREK